ncbi:MAG: hypothetical protein ACK5O1_00330 [Holosporales bacterium]
MASPPFLLDTSRGGLAAGAGGVLYQFHQYPHGSIIFCINKNKILDEYIYILI